MSTVETAVEIRPFRIHIPEDALDDLRQRITATQWPEQETVPDQSQGAPLAMMQELARYWATEYDWRRCEATLNGLPQFMTEIDGLEARTAAIEAEIAAAETAGAPAAASTPSRAALSIGDRYLAERLVIP